MEHYSDGLFGEPASTVWTRGKAEPVYWTTGAGHKGGYAYRLCKIPPGGVSQITEECFNQGIWIISISFGKQNGQFERFPKLSYFRQSNSHKTSLNKKNQPKRCFEFFFESFITIYYLI